MASSGRPTEPTPVDLYPPATSAPEATPSAAQRRGEAQLAWDNARPIIPKGNKHNGNGWPGK